MDIAKPQITVNDKTYSIDLARMYELVTSFEALVFICESREELERRGQWTPEMDDEFYGAVRCARETIGVSQL